VAVTQTSMHKRNEWKEADKVAPRCRRGTPVSWTDMRAIAVGANK
jgi:hypothetical protein